MLVDAVADDDDERIIADYKKEIEDICLLSKLNQRMIVLFYGTRWTKIEFFNACGLFSRLGH